MRERGREEEGERKKSSGKVRERGEGERWLVRKASGFLRPA